MRRKSQHLILAAGLTAAMLLFSIVGCAKTEPVNSARQESPQTTTPKSISTSDLKSLHWIEGTWRGTGDVEKPFFERYYFENDSTLAVESFTDETLSKVDDVTRFELKDGQFGNGGEGSRWAATKLDDASITFEPVVKARNTFRWEKESKDVWKAVLNWPGTEGNPAKQRVYRMERVPAPKK
jgi:hypothetical protein